MLVLKRLALMSSGFPRWREVVVFANVNKPFPPLTWQVVDVESLRARLARGWVATKDPPANPANVSNGSNVTNGSKTPPSNPSNSTKTLPKPNALPPSPATKTIPPPNALPPSPATKTSSSNPANASKVESSREKKEEDLDELD